MNIYGETFEYNILETHIESLSKTSVIKCLKLVTGFLAPAHWTTHVKRRNDAKELIKVLKGTPGQAKVQRAKNFLHACARGVPEQARQFLSVGKFEFVIRRRGKSTLRLDYDQMVAGRPGQWEAA